MHYLATLLGAGAGGEGLQLEIKFQLSIMVSHTIVPNAVVLSEFLVFVLLYCYTRTTMEFAIKSLKFFPLLNYLKKTVFTTYFSCFNFVTLPHTTKKM